MWGIDSRPRFVFPSREEFGNFSEIFEKLKIKLYKTVICVYRSELNEPFGVPNLHDIGKGFILDDNTP